MYTNAISMMNNAAFGTMKNTNSLMGLMRNACTNSGQNTESVFKQEKALQADNLQNSLIYKASDLMEDSNKKLEKDKIKRTFSMFA